MSKDATIRHLQADLKRFKQVQEMALLLNSQRSFDDLFQAVVSQVSQIVEVDRTSLFLLDEAQQQLWTKAAEGLMEEIRVPIGVGLAGKCAQGGQPILVHDIAANADFDSSWDAKLGYVTKTMLCYPIFNRRGELKGVLQMINKKDDLFSTQDQELAQVCAAQVGGALENFQLIEELRQAFESFIRTLTETIDAKHKLTAGHSHRVTEYALFFAKFLQLDEVTIDVLKYAALLHDLGKVAVPDRVLTKNGRFTAEELEIMHSHPLWTGRILTQMRLPRHLSELPSIASSHHERIDGGGYPQGVADADIPYLAKIIAVADVFDALSSRRDYPKYDEQSKNPMGCGPLGLDRVFDILQQGAGEQLDADLVALAVAQRPGLEGLWRRLHARGENSVAGKVLTDELHELLHGVFPAYLATLQPIVADVGALYRGEWAQWQFCQVPYHNMDHVYAVLVVALQIFAGDEWSGAGQGSEQVRQSRLKVLTTAALFHDSGYLKGVDDRYQGSGGRYTFEHVERSQQLAQSYLVNRQDWSDDERVAVQALIGATKIVDVNDEPLVVAAEFADLMDVLASADLLAQVADDQYLEQLPQLYAEFEEAYEWKGRNFLQQRGFTVFDSHQQLLAGSGSFIRNQVLERLQSLGNKELALQNYFKQQPSPYLKQIHLNLQRVETL